MEAAKGTVFKYGDNIDTDVIIPARYLNSSDPAELATHCMDMAITHEVYAKYRGTYKRRRENGGLRDHSNYNIEVYRDGDSIIGYVKNVATGVGRAYRLDEAIVYGDQYDWELSRIYKMQPFPRDFYQGTIDRIEASNWVYHVRRKMNMRGWHTVGK